jgi:hypothetical protein
MLTRSAPIGGHGSAPWNDDYTGLAVRLAADSRKRRARTREHALDLRAERGDNADHRHGDHAKEDRILGKRGAFFFTDETDEGVLQHLSGSGERETCQHVGIKSVRRL